MRHDSDVKWKFGSVSFAIVNALVGRQCRHHPMGYHPMVNPDLLNRSKDFNWV